MAKEKNDTGDRELIITRELDAPIDLVWEVWTRPEHIAQWWGPDGFSTTISEMDVRPEGLWNLVMHGPDGTDYDNRSVYKEVVKHKKIVYDHISDPHILATIEFEARGEKTFIRWHMLFESREQFIEVVKKYKADEGLKQNIEKIIIYLDRRKALRN